MSDAISPHTLRPESKGDTFPQNASATAPPLDATLGGTVSRVETAAQAPRVLASDAAPRKDGAMHNAIPSGATSFDGATISGGASAAFDAAAPHSRVLASGANAGKESDVTLAARPQPFDAAQEEPSLLEIGAKLGPYEVQSHIGDGGMASVYRVWHTGLHRVEALKVPRQQGRFGPEAAFLRRLLAEARTVANLQHPNIAAIYAISDAASPLQYFSMEYIEGGDLSAFLTQHKQFSPSVALPILEQVALALDYAHAQNVIHRDIKPANILLQREGENYTAKVVDFGISRANEEAGGTRLTRSGMIVGTPEYMSPEQSGSGDDVTERTDEYSLGVLAYEMLCGVPPFVAGEGVSRLSLLMKHVGEAPETPARRVSGLPAAASDAIIKALAKKPDERFASCSEFIAALREGLAGHDGIAAARSTLHSTSSVRDVNTRTFAPAENTLEIAPVAPRTPRLTTMMAGVGGLLAGVALVFSWLGFGSSPSTAVTISTPQTLSSVAPIPAKTPREYSQARVAPRIVIQRENVSFAKVTHENAALEKGRKRVIQEGRAGTREVRLQIAVRDGVQDVQRGATRILTPPRAEITEIGTQEKSATPAVAPPKVASTRQAPSATRNAQNGDTPTQRIITSPRRIIVKRARVEKPRRARRRASSSVKKVRASASSNAAPRRRRVARSSSSSSPTRRKQRVARASTRASRRTSRVRSVRRSTPSRRIARGSSGSFRGVEAALPP